MNEYVIMPKADYVAACNAIRTKTEKTDLIKSGDLESEILGIESGGSDVPYTTITVTAKRAGVVIPGATVTAVNGTETAAGVTGEDGKCILKVSKGGTWSISVSKDGGTVTTSTSVSFKQYNATATLFYATITVACETGATVTLKKPDGSVITEPATSERTVFTVYSSGTYTAIVEYNGITKTETVAVSTTVGQNYQTNMYVTHLNLEETSWEQIRTISDEGNAANYFAVGDTKSVALNGTVGDLAVNATYYVYIIGINHNAEFEGNGIHFGCFKTANGKDIALVDEKYGYATSSSTVGAFRFSANGSISWPSSEIRQKVLGSTGTISYVSEATATASYNTNNTIMGAIPSNLRSVIKPVQKYFWYRSNNSNSANQYVKDYFSLLSYYEITGNVGSYSDDFGTQMFETYCKQYAYYANGASKIKYKHNAQTEACKYWMRDQGDSSANTSNILIDTYGNTNYDSGNRCLGIAPIFVV